MKRNILKITFIAAVAVAAGYTAYSQSQKTEALFDLALENVEALAQSESQGMKYERQKQDITEIWDDASGTYKKVVITVCEGKGSLDC